MMTKTECSILDGAGVQSIRGANNDQVFCFVHVQLQVFTSAALGEVRDLSCDRL